MNDYDNVVFLSAGIEGRNDGPRTTEEAVYCQKWVKGRVGKSTNLEKERFALVDGEGNDEELFGRADRRCEIGGVGSEEPETFLILLGRRRQREREVEGHSGKIRPVFSFFPRLWKIPMDRS